MRIWTCGFTILLLFGCSKPEVTNADAGIVAPAPEMVFYDEDLDLSAAQLEAKFGKPTEIRKLKISNLRLVGPLQALASKEKAVNSGGEVLTEFLWDQGDWKVMVWLFGEGKPIASVRYNWRRVEF